MASARWRRSPCGWPRSPRASAGWTSGTTAGASTTCRPSTARRARDAHDLPTLLIDHHEQRLVEVHAAAAGGGADHCEHEHHALALVACAPAHLREASGVAVGDTVVASATFLVDAESNLGTAFGGMGNMPGMDMPGMQMEHPKPAPPASPPAKARPARQGGGAPTSKRRTTRARSRREDP